jgi:hypothetical protein
LTANPSQAQSFFPKSRMQVDINKLKKDFRKFGEKDSLLEGRNSSMRG